MINNHDHIQQLRIKTKVINDNCRGKKREREKKIKTTVTHMKEKTKKKNFKRDCCEDAWINEDRQTDSKK